MIKSIMLDKEIDDKIKRMKQEYGFNFSDWVRRQFRDNFLSVSSKKVKIGEHMGAIAKLNEEIAEITRRENTYSKIYSREEKRFLIQVPRMVREGCDWKSLMNRFNGEFSRSLLFDEFKMVISALRRKMK